MNEYIIKEIENIVTKKLKNLDEAFGVLHMKTVVRYAKILADKENCNKDLCILSAMLHDIGMEPNTDLSKENISDNHGIKGAGIARRILAQFDIEPINIDIIYTAIERHCFPGMQETIYDKILWDSDKLNYFSSEMQPIYQLYFQSSGLTSDEALDKIRFLQEFYREELQLSSSLEIANSWLMIN